MEPSERERCRQRLHSRLPLIGSWLRTQAVNLLVQDGSAEAVRILAEAAAGSNGTELPRDAFQALQGLARNGNPPAREALCRLVIQHDHGPARQAVLAAGYAPHEETRRALFYFLTGQWEEYESLDFNHQLLRTAYEEASEPLRRRIASRARQAGRVEWMTIMDGGRRGLHLAAMTDSEWKTTLTVLAGRERWEDLWRLAQEAPPRWGVQLLRRLVEAGWEPPAPDRPGFDEFTQRAASWEEKDFSPWLHALGVLRGHQDEVKSLVLNRSASLLASGGADKTIRLWSLPDGKPLHVLKEHTGTVTCLALNPKGQVLASGGKDGKVWLWDVPEGRPRKRLKGHRRAITGLAITPNGRVLVSAGLDGGLQLWSLPDGKSLHTLEGHAEGILTLAPANDGSMLATAGSDCTVRLWSLPDGRLLKTLSGHRANDLDAVLSLAITPDGQTLASGGTDGEIRLWRLPGGGALSTLKGHLGSVTALAFNPRGDVLISGGGDDHHLRLWRWQQSELLTSEEAHSGEVSALAVSPPGRFFASVSGNTLGQDNRVRLWSLPDGRAIKTLYGHHRQINCLTLSMDGRLLVSGGSDHTVRLWGSELARLVSLPVGKATLHDLEWVQAALEKDDLSEAERAALNFLAALMRWRRRMDILVEEAAPRVLEIGEFDIEIEG